MRAVDKKLIRNVLGSIEIDGEKYVIKQPTLGQTLTRLKKFQEFNEYQDSVKDQMEENPDAFLEFSLKKNQWMIEDVTILTGLPEEVVENMTEEMRDKVIGYVMNPGENGDSEEEKITKKKRKGSRGGK